VCKEALFDNYHDAFAHEKECTGDGAKSRSEQKSNGDNLQHQFEESRGKDSAPAATLSVNSKDTPKLKRI